jgi:hypothetical protein
LRQDQTVRYGDQKHKPQRLDRQQEPAKDGDTSAVEPIAVPETPQQYVKNYKTDNNIRKLVQSVKNNLPERQLVPKDPDHALSIFETHPFFSDSGGADVGSLDGLPQRERQSLLFLAFYRMVYADTIGDRA